MGVNRWRKKAEDKSAWVIILKGLMPMTKNKKKPFRRKWGK
jgi:hypothetical protein